MKKQLYLNFIYSKWIWYFGVIIIALNLLTAFGQTYVNAGPMIEFLSVLNVIAIVFTISSVQNVHSLISKNNSHHLLYSLPIHKSDILKSDYLYHILMLVFTALIFSSHLMISQSYHLYYGLVMIIGVSLCMMAIYHMMFSRNWMDNLNVKYVIYFIPLVIIMMFHFMPLSNMFDYNLELNAGWNFFLLRAPFVVLIIGVIVYTASYYYAKKEIVKSDII